MVLCMILMYSTADQIVLPTKSLRPSSRNPPEFDGLHWGFVMQSSVRWMGRAFMFQWFPSHYSLSACFGIRSWIFGYCCKMLRQFYHGIIFPSPSRKLTWNLKKSDFGRSFPSRTNFLGFNVTVGLQSPWLIFPASFDTATVTIIGPLALASAAGCSHSCFACRVQRRRLNDSSGASGFEGTIFSDKTM